VQRAFADARGDLSAHGVLYPGNRYAHHGAALALIGKAWGWRGDGGKQPPLERFDGLVREVHRWSGRSFISSEHLCEADDAAVARLAEAVDRDRLHVVVTLRSLGKLLPSSWQQYLKYGIRSTYDEWLENVFTEGAKPINPSFWKRNDHGALARRWADAIGPERVTFLILEDVDTSAVFRAMAQMLDLPEEILTSRMNLTSNRSMTVQEAELLRRVNEIVKEPLSWGEYETYVREGFVRGMVEERTPPKSEARLHTPDWALKEAAHLGAAHVEVIRQSGVRVIGDLDALSQQVRSDAPPAAGATDSVAMDAAVQALSSLVIGSAMSRRSAGLVHDTRALARRWRRSLGRRIRR
jgi:hypothetical protein